MRDQLVKIREKMQERKLSWYLVPTTDFHGSEYVNDYFKCREYLSGFTGSEGTLLIGREDAWLWTDGRYFLQAEQELKNSGITLMKMFEDDVPDLFSFLEENIKDGNSLGADGRVLNGREGQRLENLLTSRHGRFLWDMDLTDEVWKERPQLVSSPIYPLPITSTGESTTKKIDRLRLWMNEKGIDCHIMTRLEEIAWLFNLRGSDIAYTPVFYAYTIITAHDVSLYVRSNLNAELLVSKETQEEMSCFLHICSYDSFMEQLPKLQGNIVADCTSVNYAIIKCLGDQVTLIDEPGPCGLWKAVKNSTEIQCTRNAHRKDGVAMVQFLYWLKQNVASKAITELGASDHLEACRALQDDFIMPSFETISGYGSNGAIVHYCVTKESDALLKPEGFYLVDSGGQYLDGTTDITRTVVLGFITDDMKENYTAVLKGNLDLAMSVFDSNTNAYELDKIARRPIQERGLDYNHGTGHGVGHILSVHEGPNTISKRNHISRIDPGMITSDEPGVYLEGKYGIRLENEILCVNREDGKRVFEVLTLCPFDREAILPDRLTDEEKTFLNAYHKRVYNMLKDYLSEEERQWLKKQTDRIE